MCNFKFYHIIPLMAIGLMSLLPQNAQAQCTAIFDYHVSGQTLTVIDSSITTNGHYRFWDWGDGSGGSNTPVDHHTYSSSGTYTVCILIHDTVNQCADTFCQNITISANCDAAFSYSTSNLTTYLSNNSTGNNLTYYWDFGDGSTSNSLSPSHTYSSPGTYTVCLLVEDSAQTCQDSVCHNITVDTAGCSANFIIYPDSSTPFVIYVQDLSTGNNPSYNWNFGDGNTSSSPTPTHSYNSFGQFILCLTITDSNCTSTFCDTFTLDSSGNFSTKKAGFTLVVLGQGPVFVDQPQTVSQLSVFPNPFSGLIKLDAEGQPIKDVIIIDLAGRQQAYFQNGMQSLDLSHLQPGIYMLQATINGQTSTTKLVKH